MSFSTRANGNGHGNGNGHRDGGGKDLGKRLLHPLVREGGRSGTLRQATWDEALDRAAQGLKASVAAHGPSSVGFFSCSKSSNEVNFTAQKLARAVIGSNNIDSCNRT
jgi:formate dehydrogenase major subunit